MLEKYTKAVYVILLFNLHLIYLLIQNFQIGHNYAGFGFPCTQLYRFWEDKDSKSAIILNGAHLSVITFFFDRLSAITFKKGSPKCQNPTWHGIFVTVFKKL